MDGQMKDTKMLHIKLYIEGLAGGQTDWAAVNMVGYDEAFFMVQLSQLCVTTGKTIALTIYIFLANCYLCFLIWSRFVIAFLPRSKHLVISWLQSLSTVILEPKKIKSVTVSNFSPFIYHKVMGLDAMILVF